MDAQFQAGVDLHRYLVATHWNGQALIGPDPGIRFNYRIGRFVKSYLPGLAWNDDLYYLQGQGYWILANWTLFAKTGEERYREIAFRCSEYMLTRQRPDGAWDYPNPEWRGRIATTEGIWGSLGLLETYRHAAEQRFLGGALRWHKFMVETVGFQRERDTLAVNYFAHRRGTRVPNNSADALRFLAELADATGDTVYLHPCAGLLNFMRCAQEATGEFPYAVEGTAGGERRPHFQCYQYNAFQCHGLLRYHDLTGDPTVLPLISGVLGFLRGGLAPDGHAYYACGNRHRSVTYHAAALGAAFAQASQLGLDGYAALADRAYSYVLGLQRPSGSFPYSRGEYHLLSDRRSYPRYLAMILHLLLPGIATRRAAPRVRERAGRPLTPRYSRELRERCAS